MLMDYERIYNQIIDRARNRKLKGYKELHHIIPKCIGGCDSFSNIVALTAREHYVCHWLLTRIYPKHSKLSYAFWFMSYQDPLGKRDYRITSRAYQEAKENIKMSTEHKAKIVAHRKGKKIIVHPDTKEIRYVDNEDLPGWIEAGWENTNLTKGKRNKLSTKGRKTLSKKISKRNEGKKYAAKGPYTVEFEDGRKFTEQSYPDLVRATGLKYGILQWRLSNNKTHLQNGWRIYR